MSSGVKIIVVDDEPDFEPLITQRFRRHIRDQEFTFRFAHHGRAALDILETEPDTDLMLVDINMPVMDGLSLSTNYADGNRACAQSSSPHTGTWSTCGQR